MLRLPGVLVNQPRRGLKWPLEVSMLRPLSGGDVAAAIHST